MQGFNLTQNSSILPDINLSIKLKTTLYPYQQHGVKWMCYRESEQSRYSKGGILADDPGIGKTIQSIATILTNEIEKTNKKYSATTLVVCPAGLIKNWIKEIKLHTTLKESDYFVYYADSQRKEKLKKKKKAPIIIFTSYGTVTSEYKGDSKFISKSLFKREIGRVMLDEGHAIKNRSTKGFIAIDSLQTSIRWVITATPMHNNTNEMFSYFKFLGIFDNYADWKQEFGIRKDVAMIQSIKKLQTYLGFIAIQRKQEAVLELPKMTEEYKFLEFSPLEQEFYDTLLDYSHDRIRQMIAKIRELKRSRMRVNSDINRTMYNNVLLHILRLRQACCSPELVIDSMKRLNSIEVENKNKIREAIKVLDFYVKNKEKIQECQICMDSDADQIAAPCGHRCCEDCWDKVKDSTGRCPYCQGIIDRIDPVEDKKIIRNGKLIDVKMKSENEDSELQLESTKINEMVKDISYVLNKGEKLIIGSQWTRYLDIIIDEFKKHFPNVEYIYLNGKVPIKKRMDLVEEFQENNDIKVMIISIMSSSEGYNLTGTKECKATTVIHLEPWWNSMKTMQLSYRIQRVGQTKPVRIIHYRIKDSIEEKISQIIEKKDDLREAIFNSKKLNKMDDWMKTTIQLISRDQIE